MVWEFVFLMVILKIPVIYLCAVVYWAVRGDRGPAEPARIVARPDIEPRPPWTRPPSGSPRRAARLARPPLLPRRAASSRRRLSAQPVERASTADTVGGFLAVVSIAAALLSLAYRPVRVDVFAIVLAFVATGLCSGRNQRLAAIAVATSAVCFIVGIVIAILRRQAAVLGALLQQQE